MESSLRPARSLGQQGLAGEISAANVTAPPGVYNDTITLNYQTAPDFEGPGPFTPQTLVIPVVITVVDPNDLDADGVVNGSDLCPNTPMGEAVDVDGCADSQVFLTSPQARVPMAPCPHRVSRVLTVTALLPSVSPRIPALRRR